MKRALVLALVVGLLAGMMLMPAEAKKKKKPAPAKVERVVELPYQCPCGVWNPASPAGFWLAGGAVGGALTPTGGDDKFVKVEITDASGQKVNIGLAQNVDGTDNFAEVPVGEVCGTTEEPLAVPNPGVQVDIFVYEGTCTDMATPSIATSGTIKLTFSNMP
ncbi:MAG: hypothetical protein QOG54_288 [Actinomycetota bacterium]|jgi:hypothetical protein|nr:hypothetical protein [Actinomycetota bacterium]